MCIYIAHSYGIYGILYETNRDKEGKHLYRICIHKYSVKYIKERFICTDFLLFRTNIKRGYQNVCTEFHTKQNRGRGIIRTEFVFFRTKKIKIKIPNDISFDYPAFIFTFDFHF